MTHEDDSEQHDGGGVPADARVVAFPSRPEGTALSTGEKALLDGWLLSCGDAEDRAALRRIIHIFG